MTASNTDRIEQKVHLRAPISRVWRAIASAEEFGTWFRVKIDGQFAPGARVKGRITHPGYEHVTMDMEIERMDPELLFSYRWHPYAIDPKADYSAEPTTLVELRLSAAPEGTLLTVVESGFDQIPAHRRSEAFRMNQNGWIEQLKNIEKHVTPK